MTFATRNTRSQSSQPASETIAVRSSSFRDVAADLFRHVGRQTRRCPRPQPVDTAYPRLAPRRVFVFGEFPMGFLAGAIREELRNFHNGAGFFSSDTCAVRDGCGAKGVPKLSGKAFIENL